MNQQSNPRKRTSGLSIQPVGEETLLYDERTHKAFCLNRVAGTVWQLCDGSRDLTEIRNAASVILGAPVSAETVQLALTDLQRDGLVEAEGAVAMLSRRALVAQIGAGAALMIPVVAVVMAPKAAQAYTGCFDCSSNFRAAQQKAVAQQYAAQQMEQQKRASHNPFDGNDSGVPQPTGKR